jgi:hypothetical protein
MAGKLVAIAGVSDAAKKVNELLAAKKSAITITNYSNIRDICRTDIKYDYIIFDEDEFGAKRQEFAQNSRYKINAILYAKFLLEGGYYAR